jgi:hypothetical protein
VDGPQVEIAMEEEKGSSGKYHTMHFQQKLFDRIVHSDPVSGSKVERATPVSALAEQGRVCLLRGQWNQKFLNEAANFPLGKRDSVDSISGSYKMLTTQKRVWPEYDGAMPVFSIAFDNLDDDTMLLCSQWTEKDMSTSCILALWTAKTGRLVIWDEFTTTSGSPEVVIVALAQIVKRDTGDIFRNMKPFTWYANDTVFGNAGGDMQAIYRKMKINLRKNSRYDESGSIINVSQLLRRKKVLVHARCAALSRQMGSWWWDGSRSATGYGLCRAVCNLVSALHETGKLTSTQKPMKPYSRSRTAYIKDADEKMKAGQFANLIMQTTDKRVGGGRWMV